MGDGGEVARYLRVQEYHHEIANEAHVCAPLVKRFRRFLDGIAVNILACKVEDDGLDMNAGNVALFDKGLIDIVKRNVIRIEHRLREAAVPCDFHAGVELMRHLFNHKPLPKSLIEIPEAYPSHFGILISHEQ